jgi:hypothetical protein
MPIPEGVSEAGAFLYRFYQRGVAEGMGSNEMIRALREEGYGYRRTEMLSDIRLARIEWDKTDAMSRLPAVSPIPEDYYTPAEFTSVTKRYATVARTTYRDVETGEEFTDYITVGHNEPLTAGEVEEEAWEAVQGYNPEMELERVKATVANAWLGRGWE